MSAGAVGAAFDASVYAESGPGGADLRKIKCAAAVEYFKREHAAAVGAIARAEGKSEKAKRQAAEAVAAIGAAVADAEAAAERLADAQRQLVELEG